MKAGSALFFAWFVACDLGVPGPDSSAWNIDSSPHDREHGVTRRSSLVIRLDRRILPRSVTARTVRLSSGGVTPQATVRYDLLDRAIWIEPPSDAPLVADTTYELEVDGLIDLDGAAQPEPYIAYFTTGTELGDGAQPTARVDTGAVLALLHEQCSSEGCHVAPQPAAALDLSSPEGIEATITRASSQLGLESVGGQPADGALWLPATRIVDVTAGRGDPARSYLMYKVLGDSHITGARMPPRGRRLNGTELALLADWISAGARALPSEGGR